MHDYTPYTNDQMIRIFENAIRGPQGDGSWEPQEEQDARIEAARTELSRRLNKTDLEQFTEMLTRLGARFTLEIADTEDIEMYSKLWPTVHTEVTVYPIKDTHPLGYPYCYSEWLFDKDGKLIAQGASE